MRESAASSSPAAPSRRASVPAGAVADEPSAASVAVPAYLSAGGQGRSLQCGEKTKLERVRPGSNAPFPAPSA
jgi:hypothetical protein